MAIKNIRLAGAEGAAVNLTLRRLNNLRLEEISGLGRIFFISCNGGDFLRNRAAGTIRLSDSRRMTLRENSTGSVLIERASADNSLGATS